MKIQRGLLKAEMIQVEEDEWIVMVRDIFEMTIYVSVMVYVMESDQLRRGGVADVLLLERFVP